MASRPIGYWLKHLDVLIEDHFAQTLAVNAVDRRQWQLLNTLASGPDDREHLAAAVAPFLTDDPSGASRALAASVDRGWVTEDNERISLTVEGERAHRRLSQRVAESRRQMLAGITAEQYEAVVTTLERMAANLGGSAAQE